MASNRWKFVLGIVMICVVLAILAGGRMLAGSNVSASENSQIQRVDLVIIDCAAPPFIPNDSTVEEHREGNKEFVWNLADTTLFLSEEQENEIISGGPRDGRTISGEDLRKLLVDKPVLNANVLDYLLAHQELIPEEWKGRSVFFWGTIYRGFLNTSYVRALRWNGRNWFWHHGWLVYEWDFGGPAIVSKI